MTSSFAIEGDFLDFIVVIAYWAKMVMRQYWKHNVAEDMQVVEYRAEQEAVVPSVFCRLPSL